MKHVSKVHDDKEPVRFPDWAAALLKEGFPEPEANAYKTAIIRFLGECRRLRSPVCVLTCRSYLAGLEARHPASLSQAREALRWFVRRGREGGVAPAAESKLGEPGPAFPGTLASREPPAAQRIPPCDPQGDWSEIPWEQRLITAIRRRHLLWRTEQTYRQWAHRFARHLSPKTPELATSEDVEAFLTDLAVRLRCSPSTQKKALNAVLFFLQELLGHTDVRTTQIYLHVMQKPGIGVRSPLDTASS